MTSCVKCRQGAQVAMSFDYKASEVRLRDIGPGFDRYADYALCDSHADRMRPPVGWVLFDHRRTQEPPLFTTPEHHRVVAPQLIINGVA